MNLHEIGEVFAQHIVLYPYLLCSVVRQDLVETFFEDADTRRILQVSRTASFDTPPLSMVIAG